MQNVLGSLSPGTKMRSTPSSWIIARRIVPPEDPSRDMASARAAIEGGQYVCSVGSPLLEMRQKAGREETKARTIADELDRLVAAPALLERRVAVTVDVCRSRS